jgi:hypothetical protein
LGVRLLELELELEVAVDAADEVVVAAAELTAADCG